jgi:taurine--2-oxoglutarate transaminase
MCSNLGHTTPQCVIDAVIKQMKEISYCYPCQTVTPIKAKLSSLLADIFPGDLNTFFFTCGGSESNETAIRMARKFTGRHKIIARYRSYHGGSAGTIALTGDPRRWGSEPTGLMPGVIHIMDPYPYSFSWGKSEEEVTKNNLIYIKETIEYEGPKNIAAIFVESVTGTNGILKPPKGYLEGLRTLCDEYGILLICDEVMSGFGRTGKWFGFMHTSPLIIPDIVTMAKGINGAYIPLGAVACRDHIAEFFRKNPIGIGTTYNSHPIGLASAYAALKYMMENQVVEHVQKMELIMKQEMEKLASQHLSIKQGRVIGLFGVLDLQKNKQGEPITPYNGTPHPIMNPFRKSLLENGLFTLMRWHNVFCNPPLIIKEEEIKEGFNILHKSLQIVDQIID